MEPRDFESLFGSANDPADGQTSNATVVTVSPKMVGQEMRDTLNFLRSTNPPNLIFTAEVTATPPAASVNEVRLE